MPPIVIDRELQSRLTRLSRVRHPGLKHHATSILRDLQQGRASSKSTAGDGHYLKTLTGSYELHKTGSQLILTAHHQATRTVFTLGWLGQVNVQIW